MQSPTTLLEPLKELHDLIRASVVEACENSAIETMAGVDRDEEGDTIYAVDRISEDLLIDFCERKIATITPIVLIAEGLQNGKVALPRGVSEEDTQFRLIVDPIDGTRGLMYQKRSAWILTGVAPNRGPQTGLTDITLAVQTEIPLVKQHLSDQAWASTESGVQAVRFNRLTGQRTSLHLQPSRAKTIAHGYAQVARFFPGARDELAKIDEEVVFGALGPAQYGKAHCFEDQYASSGGQLFELMSGHDRFIADLRPLMGTGLTAKRQPLGICSHPYDVCTELIARQAGVIVTDVFGRPLNAELSVEPNVAWVGYANADIRSQIEPLLREALERRGLLGNAGGPSAASTNK